MINCIKSIKSMFLALLEQGDKIYNGNIISGIRLFISIVFPLLLLPCGAWFLCLVVIVLYCFLCFHFYNNNNGIVYDIFEFVISVVFSILIFIVLIMPDTKIIEGLSNSIRGSMFDDISGFFIGEKGDISYSVAEFMLWLFLFHKFVFENVLKLRDFIKRFKKSN
ncbi:hypothetical protein QP437_02015 [Haemophilus sp. UMB1048]|uniref:hypothetical protein n=1 Tax=Haemophilus sp. UMB1048 TaxID=3046322 RepID=UPI002552245F|nr:hypothetical protein [Haemophilus sp. UMB1048]MDK7253672.1 hypothetical protein [Haemophilus sp. UMB1048]